MPYGLHPAEFVPAAPLLPVLAELMGYVVAFGLCVMALYVVKALFAPAAGLTAHLPWIGKTVSGGVTTIEHKLTNGLQGAVSGLDHRMAQAWYKLASIAEKIGHEIAANAGLLTAIAATIAGLPGFADWRAFIRKVKALLAWAEQHAIGAVHTLTRPLTANVSALSRWARAQIRVLRHAIDVTIPHSIAGLRHRTRVIERALERDWKLLKKHERLLGIGAMTGVVAVVLSRLGLGWMRCRNVGRLGKAACGMDNSLLEALLADTLAIVGTISIVELARELQRITPTVTDAISGVIREAS